MDCRTSHQWMEVCRPTAGDLDLAELAELRAHLAECPGCRARLAVQRDQDAAIGRVIRAVPVPADLKRAILRRLAPPSAAPPRRRWKPVLLSAAAAAVVLLGVGLLIVGVHRQAAVVDINDPVVQQWAEQGLARRPVRMIPDNFGRDQIESWCWHHLDLSVTVPETVAVRPGWKIGAFRDRLPPTRRPVVGFQYLDRRRIASAVIYALPAREFRPPRKACPAFETYAAGELQRYAFEYWYESRDQTSYIAVKQGTKEDLNDFLHAEPSYPLARRAEPRDRGRTGPRVHPAVARGWRRLLERAGFHKK